MKQKARISSRILAKAIDLLLVFFFAISLPYPVGPFLGFLYSLLGDGISLGQFNGQSLGKKLMQLRVISRETHQPGKWRDSAFRNSPVAVATFFGIIPIWGWIVLACVGLPLMAVEIYMMVRAEDGRHWGDVIGNTIVIEVRS